MKTYLTLALLFLAFGVQTVWGQAVNPSTQPYRDKRDHSYQPRPNHTGHHHQHNAPVYPRPAVSVVIGSGGGCFETQKTWVAGFWQHNAWGQRVWVQGHWQTRQVAVPCPAPACPAPAPVYGPVCSQPSLYADGFSAAMNSIVSRSFESSRLSIAEQIIAANCLTSAQVKEMMFAFSYESSRLQIARMAYVHVCDPQNYYLVNDAFQFESSINQLNAYLSTIR